MNTPTDPARSSFPRGAWPPLATIAVVILAGCATPVVPSAIVADPTVTPADPTVSPAASAEDSVGDATYRAGDVLIGLEQPTGWQVRSDTGERVVGFDDRTSAATGPLGYGWIGARKEEGAHGIVVADLTGIEFHNNEQPPLARTAAEFLDNLASLDMGSAAQPSYTVGAVEATEVGGRPALTANIEANTGYAMFEGRLGHLALDLSVPQRVIVADIGGSILLVQIWAESEVELAAWLPRAEELLDLMTFASDASQETRSQTLGRKSVLVARATDASTKNS